MAASWQFVNVDEFKAGLKRIQADIDLVNQVAVVDAAVELQRLTRAAAPRSSGLLAGSIDYRGPRRDSSGSAYAEVGPTIKYGRRIELGFKGNRAAPRRGYSRDFSRRGLQATKAEPYLAPTLAASARDLGQIFVKSWRKAWR